MVFPNENNDVYPERASVPPLPVNNYSGSYVGALADSLRNHIDLMQAHISFSRDLLSKIQHEIIG